MICRIQFCGAEAQENGLCYECADWKDQMSVIDRERRSADFTLKLLIVFAVLFVITAALILILPGGAK